MSWCGFFCLCPATYTFGYVVEIYYFINFNSWMSYCACWHCDDMLLGVLIPISISFCLHRTKILCFNNQFSSSNNLSINCCVVLKFIWFWFKHDNIKPFVAVSCVLMTSYYPDSNNEAVFSLIPSRTIWCISSNASEGVYFCGNCIMFQLLNVPNTGQ